jgi:hypothetical protein
LERHLIVFGGVAVNLSRVEQWEISADHGFSQISAPYRMRRVDRPLAAGRGVIVREPSLIVSARLKEPKLVADLFGSVVFADPSALSVENWRSR